jgi:hypothetical protein
MLHPFLLIKSLNSRLKLRLVLVPITVIIVSLYLLDRVRLLKDTKDYLISSILTTTNLIIYKRISLTALRYLKSRILSYILSLRLNSSIIE